jgi:hypothetical protein
MQLNEIIPGNKRNSELDGSEYQDQLLYQMR